MAKHIVIVEDDPDQRSNYADAITNKGYQVSAYGSREEALAGFDVALPDLAILDIILGDEVDAGFQLCRELLARSPSLPVILRTLRKSSQNPTKPKLNITIKHKRVIIRSKRAHIKVETSTAPIIKTPPIAGVFPFILQSSSSDT